MNSAAQHRPLGLDLAARPRRPLGGMAAVATVLVALLVACCAPAPRLVIAAADLTLAAAGGLGVGALIVVGMCMLRPRTDGVGGEG
jgi:hypothetical protein